MNAKQVVARYLIIQAAGVATWWGLLLFVPQTIAWFQPEAWPRTTLLGFWLADSLLLIGGSLVAAGLVTRKRRSAATVLWCLAAVVWYPTLYCIGVSIMTDEAWLASAMMAGIAGLTLAMATIHGNAHQEAATVTMATQGHGTPLPTATAPRLVVAGPYRIVRNPMAVAGILQGIAVGWWFGSISVIVYALLGAILWHFIIRPFEEADLQARFGDSYSRYREAVGLWVPRLRT